MKEKIIVTLERDIEQAIVRYAEKRGIFISKLSFLSRRGAPDRMMIYQSRVIFMEIKKPGGRVSKIQQHMINTLKQHGCTTAVVYSLEDAKEIIDQFIDGSL